MTIDSQNLYLSTAKKNVEARYGRALSWDEFAALVDINPRAFKTYRLPETSANYREMPSAVRHAIDAILSRPPEVPRGADTLVKALAALVISQAEAATLDNQVITGLDRQAGSRSGLTIENRKIMALVSRFSLESGLPDLGGEIHDLLFNCTRPLQDWLRVPAVLDAGYGPTVLIDAEYGSPTPEAQELASEFSTLSAHLEEKMFAALREVLAKHPKESANDYYTSVREFVVRNPVTSMKEVLELGRTVPSALLPLLSQSIYEPVPPALASSGSITLCGHCNSMMRKLKTGAIECSTRACRLVNKSNPGHVIPVEGAQRVTRGVHQYWVEPGLDEIRIFDMLVKAGLKPVLYPVQDRVDLSVGEIGMDLKTYVSPEILGAKFRKSLGGLNYYAQRWVVIPDWLLAGTVNYLKRLEGAMGENASHVRCLSLSQAVKLAIKESARA